MFDLQNSSAQTLVGQCGKSARRIFLVLTLALILPVLASAYTIVMRDGRRLEISDAFPLTATNLTNELEAARAGLIARWQLLEDEARRAGVLP